MRRKSTFESPIHRVKRTGEWHMACEEAIQPKGRFHAERLLPSEYDAVGFGR